MTIENVLLIGGVAGLDQFERVEVTLATHQTPPEFSCLVTEAVAGHDGMFSTWNFPPDTPVEIMANDDLLIAGTVTDYEPSADVNDHRVMIRGTGQQRDFTDCSCQHATGTFENKSVLQIGQELAAPYGIPVEQAGSDSSGASEVVGLFQTRRGSTPWFELMRLAPQRGLTIHGTKDGKVQLVGGTDGAHAGGLVQGKNIIRMSARLSSANTFGSYDIIGQPPLGVDAASMEAWGTALGAGAPGRHTERVDTASTDSGLAAQHAQWWARRSDADSAEATIVTPSWRDDAGALWRVNCQVFVYAPFLKLNQNMMLTRVVFSQDLHQGTIATLTLNQAEGWGAVTAGGVASPWNSVFGGQR